MNKDHLAMKMRIRRMASRFSTSANFVASQRPLVFLLRHLCMTSSSC